MSNNTKLIFIYNADSGLFNTITDIAHKIISPSTYACQLCALTHSHFSVRKEWVAFLEKLDIELEFLHKDEMKVETGIKNLTFPVILLNTDEHFEVLMDHDAIDQCQDLETFKQRILSALDAHSL